jgi:hypothetical protein
MRLTLTATAGSNTPPEIAPTVYAPTSTVNPDRQAEIRVAAGLLSGCYIKHHVTQREGEHQFGQEGCENDGLRRRDYAGGLLQAHQQTGDDRC